MESAKRNAIKAIEQLPEESSYEDIVERLLFIQKVEAGLDDIRRGNVVSHDEAKRRLAKWLR